MIQAAITLVAVALLSFISKDRILMAAAIVLAVLSVIDNRQILTLLQKNAFPIGIFFLMIFILLPIATQKISLLEMGNRLLSLEGALAIAAGFAVSFIGGKGVGILSSQPTILAGVTVGTLIAVLFLDGLPAGLIIAAGLMTMLGKIPG